MSVFGTKSRAVVLAGSGLFLLALPGCRWQVGKVPLPFPTPTPSPTPTPTPVAFATDVGNALVEGSISAKVAMASADFFAAATSEASESASAAREALSAAQQDSEALAIALQQAKKSLTAARDAYLKSGATVFFVDPDSVEELRSQPDPFGTGILAGEPSALDDLQAALARLEALLDGSFTFSKAADLILEAKTISALLEQTEAGFRDMADAWRPEDAGNFRSEYFLASTDGALARLFQGLLAVTGDLLPATLANDQSSNKADVASLVSAVREIYLGEGVSAGEVQPTLHTLVQQASPVQAALTRASIARAVALASVLEIAPDNDSVKSQLSPALQDLTRQLAFAANSLGIVILTDE